MSSAVHTNERRERTRVALQCPVRLSRAGSASVLPGVTRDMSSSGFYFLSTEPFVPGEQLRCTIAIPTHAWSSSGERLLLDCSVEVARVEHLGPGKGMGVACRIVDYSVVHYQGSNPPAAETCPA